MNARVHSRIGMGVLVVALAAVAGCARTAPTSPTQSADSASQAVVAPGLAPNGGLMVRRSSVTQFPLVSGTFTISNDSGDSLSGTYSGTSFVSAGSPERIALTMTISSGTGVYAGASGTLSASGLGVFTGEGPFILDVKGDAIVRGKHVPIRVNLTGTSTVSCSEDSHIIISATATGSMKKTGDVHATLVHEVGQSSCGA